MDCLRQLGQGALLFDLNLCQLYLQVLSLLEDAKAGRPLARPTESASPLSPSAAQNLFSSTTVSCFQATLHILQCHAANHFTL